MSEPGAPQPHSTRYRLFLAWGGINMRLRDNGIAPEADGLRYTRDGRQEFKRYSDIASVNLAMTSMPRAADVAQLTIRFRNGLAMHVMNTDAWGRADAEQTQLYYRFKADLHQRLIDHGLAHDIKFATGVSAGRTKTMTVALLLAAAFFILLPLVIFVMTGRAEVLLAMLAGAGFLLPLLRSAQRNQPGTYDPSDPPDMLQ